MAGESIDEGSLKMKRKAGKYAAVLLAALMLTGCGSNLLEEGTALLEEGNYEEAASTFQEAVDEDGQDPEGWRGLGLARWEQQDYEGALEAFQSVLDNGGEKTGELYNLMGCCAMQLGKPTEALNYFRLGMEAEDVSDEMMKEMRFNEIAAYEQSGDMESAKSKLKDYTADYPDDEKAAKEAEFLETR